MHNKFQNNKNVISFVLYATWIATAKIFGVLVKFD